MGIPPFPDFARLYETVCVCVGFRETWKSGIWSSSRPGGFRKRYRCTKGFKIKTGYRDKKISEIESSAAGLKGMVTNIISNEMNIFSGNTQKEVKVLGDLKTVESLSLKEEIMLELNDRIEISEEQEAISDFDKSSVLIDDEEVKNLAT